MTCSCQFAFVCIKRTIVCHGTIICNSTFVDKRCFFSNGKTVIQVQPRTIIYFNCYLAIHIYCFIQSNVAAYFNSFNTLICQRCFQCITAVNSYFFDNKPILQCKCRTVCPFQCQCNCILDFSSLEFIHNNRYQGIPFRFRCFWIFNPVRAFQRRVKAVAPCICFLIVCNGFYSSAIVKTIQCTQITCHIIHGRTRQNRFHGIISAGYHSVFAVNGVCQLACILIIIVLIINSGFCSFQQCLRCFILFYSKTITQCNGGTV